LTEKPCSFSEFFEFFCQTQTEYFKRSKLLCWHDIQLLYGVYFCYCHRNWEHLIFCSIQNFPAKLKCSTQKRIFWRCKLCLVPWLHQTHKWLEGGVRISNKAETICFLDIKGLQKIGNLDTVTRKLNAIWPNFWKKWPKIPKYLHQILIWKTKTSTFNYFWNLWTSHWLKLLVWVKIG